MNKVNRSPIDLIQQICAALAKNAASTPEVMSIIGTPDKEKSVLNQFFISPVDQFVEEAFIVTESRKAPSYVTLEVKEPSNISLIDMEKAYGPSKSLPATPGGSSLRAWTKKGPAGSQYECALIAALAKNDDRIVRLTIRRDRSAATS